MPLWCPSIEADSHDSSLPNLTPSTAVQGEKKDVIAESFLERQSCGRWGQAPVVLLDSRTGPFATELNRGLNKPCQYRTFFTPASGSLLTAHFRKIHAIQPILLIWTGHAYHILEHEHEHEIRLEMYVMKKLSPTAN